MAAVVARLGENGDQVVTAGPEGPADGLPAGTPRVAMAAHAAEEVPGAARLAIEKLDGLDGLVVGTGPVRPGGAAAVSDADWDDAVNADILLPWAWQTACLPALRSGEGKSIVVVASGVSVTPDALVGVSSISTRVAVAMTKMLATETARSGIRVNVVGAGAGEEGDSAMAAVRPPLGRRIASSDVAAAVSFLLSSEAAFATGQTLVLDGGLSAASRPWVVAHQ